MNDSIAISGNSPKITVIMAVFNNRDTVADAIESVLGQLYKDVEFIVVDGGSTDGTTEVLERYRRHFSTYISEPDRGVYDALNKGLALATGDVVGFLHSDDLFAGNEVLLRIAELFASGKFDAVYGDLLYVRKEAPNKLVRYWKSGEFSSRRLRRGWMPPHPTLYLKRSIYERLGVFDTSFRIAADYDVVLRFFGSGNLRYYYLDAVLIKMRLGGLSNGSMKNVYRKMKEDYRALRRNRVGGLTALMLKNVMKLPQFIRRSKS